MESAGIVEAIELGCGMDLESLAESRDHEEA